MISIAIPAHNEEASIQRTLGSVINSDFKKNKFEIIICLSGCTDNTRGKINEFIKKHKFNIKIVESGIGRVAALKKLDKSIDNKIIVFLDADCTPLKDSIHVLHTGLLKAGSNIKVVSGNSVDPRYIDKTQKPKNFTEVFNRAFWQRSGRKIINGPFYAIRNGIMQKVPTDVVSDDTYLSLILWNKFINNPGAKVIQGSSQTIWEYIRYQRNFQTAYLQIINYLKDTPHFRKNFKELTSQFDVLLSNKQKYYPNLSYFQLILVNIIIFVGKIWGHFIKPIWNQTKSSKTIAQ